MLAPNFKNLNFFYLIMRIISWYVWKFIDMKNNIIFVSRTYEKFYLVPHLKKILIIVNYESVLW